MPRFRTLGPEEAARLHTRRGRTVDLTDYVDALRNLTPGQMGEAALADGEKKATIKRRLTAAAKRLGIELKYRRSSEDRVIYEVAGPK